MTHDTHSVPPRHVAAPTREEFLTTSGRIAAGAAIVGSGVPTLAGAASASTARVLRELSPITVTISRGSAAGEDWVGRLIRQFEQKNRSITVKSLFAPLSSTDAHNQYVAQLAGGSSAVDIYQVDVIWPPEFAAAGWIQPVDRWMSASAKADMLPGPALGTTINGRMYAFPLFTDFGVLYYRADLLTKYKLAPPRTWLDVVKASQTIMRHEAGVTSGILWDGSQTEGLFCDACELFWGNGGNVLQNFSGRKAVIDSPHNRQALQFMVDTIYTYRIAPTAMPTYSIEDIRHLFENGKSVFLRQWTYVWALANSKESAIAGKVGVAPIPHGAFGRSASCLGGWNLAINAKSQHADAAAQLAVHLTSAESQKYLAINASLPPTRRGLYRDPAVLQANPWYRYLYDVVTGALPRPVSKDETKISDRVQRQVNAALKREVSVAGGLANAQRDVEQIVGGNTNTP